MTTRRVLLTTLCLLALATSASAECAWMLWEQFQALSYKAVPERERLWEPNGAYATKAECESKLLFSLDFDNKVGSIALRQCLLDTVDPRGPKGK
jgi:hypothetical protein